MDIVVAILLFFVLSNEGKSSLCSSISTVRLLRVMRWNKVVFVSALYLE